MSELNKETKEFLIKMQQRELNLLINIDFQNEIIEKVIKLIKAETKNEELEINDKCKDEFRKYIFGIHKSNLIMLEDYEIKNIVNDKYKDDMADLITKMILCNITVSNFLQDIPVLGLDNYSYYPVPYLSLYLSVKGLDLVKCSDRKDILYNYFSKCIGAIELMNSNLFNCAFSIARNIIELTFIILILIGNDKAYEKYIDFIEYSIYEVDKGNKHPEFKNIVSKYKGKQKGYFKDYGWVDEISDYDSIIKNEMNKDKNLKYYSFDAIYKYLYVKLGDQIKTYILDQLYKQYKVCNKYVHGDFGGSIVPYRDYYELSSIVMVSLNAVERFVLKANKDFYMNNDINYVEILYEQGKKLMSDKIKYLRKLKDLM